MTDYNGPTHFYGLTIIILNLETLKVWTVVIRLYKQGRYSIQQ